MFWVAINFNQSSSWNLKPISIAAVQNEVNGLLISGEEVVAAFQTVRDQLLFTNKRVISIFYQKNFKKRVDKYLPVRYNN